jgi:Fic family protein
MAKVIRRRWEGQLGSGLSRRDSRSCHYEAYLPDPLRGRKIALDGDVAADVADAESAIAKLNLTATTLVDTEALARLLLRAEAVASSKIEGLEVGPRRLLRAEAAREVGEAPSDVTAAEVLGNIDAMVHAVRSMESGGKITPALLKEVHRRLLTGTRLQEHGGRLRGVQNWIGGSDHNPCSAEFVPCPPEAVRELFADLCAFCNEESLPAVAQAAIAHAQFETIHPFIDGNGRAGRAVIHLVFRRRALATRISPPVSLVLATWTADYIGGLTATRYRGPATSKVARDGLNLWMGRFAAACSRAVKDASEFEERAESVVESWRSRLGPIRANSSTDLLLRALPGAPIISVNGAAELLGRSYRAANEAVDRLVDGGVLSQVNVGRRNRAFEAREIIDAFADLERQLASPGGDTLYSPPDRTVPARRRTQRPPRS